MQNFDVFDILVLVDLQTNADGNSVPVPTYFDLSRKGARSLIRKRPDPEKKDFVLPR